MKKIFTVILSLLLIVSIAGNIVLFIQYKNMQNDFTEASKELETTNSELELAQQEIEALKDKNDGLEKKNANLASQKFAVQDELHILKGEYQKLHDSCVELLEILELYDLQWQFEFSFE